MACKTVNEVNLMKTEPRKLAKINTLPAVAWVIGVKPLPGTVMSR
jgi:hypothetical protein